jgi:predicted acyltransferase
MTTAAPLRLRDQTLDMLRGLAIVGMILANLQGSEQHAFPLLVHATWNGLTIADLVFPLFLLCAGLALPLAFDGRSPRPRARRIVRRSFLLFLIGFAIGLVASPTTHLAEIRFAGVLARIAIVYLCCALLTRSTSGWRAPALIAVVLMAVHGVLLYTPPPGGVASMAPGEGLSGWLDRAILGGTYLYGDTFDPEGPLSTLSAIATGMIGVAVARAVLIPRRPLGSLFAIAAACLLVGIGASRVWPINKALWTPSFALINAGIGVGLLGLLKLAWPVIGGWAPTRLGERLGRNALTLYVVHDLLTIAMFVPIGGTTSWRWLFETLAGIGLSLAWTSLLFAIIAGAITIVITLLLERRGWVLRL